MLNYKRAASGFAILLALTAGFVPALMADNTDSRNNAKKIYSDPKADIEARVEDALSRMTLREKINIIHAQSKFSSAGVPRLGIPELWTTDGPHGIRPEVLWDEWEQASWTCDSCVAFPALTCLAATWNTDMAREYGNALGEEALYRGKDVVLGPGVNIYRTPVNGRNFEYMGEDPYLAGQMVVPYIKGLQSNGVAACVKHFCLNNHEVNRHTTNVNVDDRTLYELYLPAFKAAVKDGGAWSIMGAYNYYKDQHLCHNQYTLNDILKGEWGFDGAVVSDWGGTHDTDQAITNGLDLEFGSWTDGLYAGVSNAYDNYYMANPYFNRIVEGKVDMAALDNKVRRVLRLIFRTAMNPDKGFGAICSDEHYATARSIGDEGIVLLKNDRNLLPLQPGKRVLVVGENAIKMMTVGGGSSSLKAQREISPLDGLRAVLGDDVDYERGYVGDVTGEYNGVVTGQDLTDPRDANQLIADAAAKAKAADYVVFIGGLNKSAGQDCEDSDRAGLELPYDQDKVIEALAAVNPNIVVVNISGNAIAMPWVAKVPAIIQAWYLGSEAGNSIADVLTGRANPSGKLPFSFPRKLADVPVHQHGNYLGTKRADQDIWDVSYDEGLMVGYRYHDTRKVPALFPFGHGLSYTTFVYGKPALSADAMDAEGHIEVSLPVTNNGSVAGSEVVQLYISDIKAPVARPLKELKGFEKVSLQPGETKVVKFMINPQDLAYFDADSHLWRSHAGKYAARIAASSADVRHSVNFKLTQDQTYNP